LEADFAQYRDFTKAQALWLIRQENKKSAETQQTAAIADSKTEMARQYNEKVAEFKKAHDDFDEVLASDLPTYQGVNDTIVELENGPEVAYFLGKHPDVARSLMELSPLRAIAEVGKIAASLVKPSTPVSRTRSPAPAPITPVGGSSVTTTSDPGEMPLAEYRRKREQGLL
jgi:hypothetical protein